MSEDQPGRIEAEDERIAAEKRREEAEEERERREKLRRIGEGGPEQHVPGNVTPGRVEAEAARVEGEEKRKDLRRFYVKLAGLVALPVAFIALLPAVIGLVYVNSVSDSTRRTLCTFKKDLEQRRLNTWSFREMHPDGVAGITRTDLNRSLSAQKATLNSLEPLDC